MRLTPLVSEKAFDGASRGLYAFRVPTAATKPTVRLAVESRYEVKVAAVRISSVPPKQRRRGRHIGLRPGYKKALVQLKKGDSIKELGAEK